MASSSALVRKKDMTVAKTDKKTAPATQKKRANVLGEEQFVDNIEKLIVRDFFPDLPKLEAQTEYIDALENKDSEKLRQLHIKYSQQNRPGKTVLQSVLPTPSTFETPECGGVSKETPKPGSSVSESHITGGHHATDEDEAPTHNPEPKPDKDPLVNMSLDKFMAKNTSEDNESFENLMLEVEKKHREKHKWLFEQEEVQQKEKEQYLALPHSELSERPAIKTDQKLDTWTYVPKNAVMYVPEGVELSDSEKIEQAGSKREIVHQNTRFAGNPFNLDKSKEVINQAASNQALNMHGKIGADGKEILPQATPKVNGFGFVATPSPAPGVEDSPLMTWGELEGTPFRLDGSDTPVLHRTPGPVFKIPDVPRRDKLALKLAEDASKAHRDKKEAALKRVRANFTTPSPKFGSASKSDRLCNLSPAAQRLVSGKLGIRTNTDQALRASYSPSPSPRRTERTPVQLTPGSSRATPGSAERSRNTPLSKSAGKSRTPVVTPASLTDDLLHLPKPKRSKAEDYF